MYPTRSQVTITPEEHRSNVEIGYATGQQGGGVGIPGGRKYADVQQFPLLNFSKLGSELGAILTTSKSLRGMDDIEDKRKAVAKVNRRVDFGAGQMGLHSLHAANDIAAVWNSTKHQRSRVYDYPDLARRLDRHLQYNADDHEVRRRRQYVAAGMREFISGDRKTGNQLFKEAGMRPLAKKWAFKMTAIMLAERGRELHGKKGGSQVFNALDKVGGKYGFTDVFVKRAKSLAPFARRGGAKSFK